MIFAVAGSIPSVQTLLMMIVIILAGLVAGGCGGWTVEDCWAGNEHLTVSVCLLLTALCTDTALWAICCSLCTVMCSAKSFPNVNHPRDK